MGSARAVRRQVLEESRRVSTRSVLIASVLLALAAPSARGEEDAASTNPAWVPDIGGGIWYNLVVPEGASLDDRTSDLERILVQTKDAFFEDRLGYFCDLQHKPGRLGSYPRETWLDAAYLRAETPVGTVRLGSVYTPIGPIWDHTYYGSLFYYKGYKHDADYGVVFENKREFPSGTELTTSVGYFLQEDGLHGATIIGQGYEYASDAEERNTFAARVNPTFTLGDGSKLSCGLSALAGQIDSATADGQFAVGLDACYSRGPLTLALEYARYDQDAGGGDPALRGHLLGTEAYWKVYEDEAGRFAKSVALNLNYSQDFPDSGDGLGRLWLPSVSVKFADNLKMDITYVNWESGGTDMDKSWRLVLYLSF